MMDFVTVELTDQAVARITLNRPDCHNAFDDRLIAGLTATLQKIAAEGNVRLVVLAARGKSFSAGADLGWMRRMADYTEAENQADSEKLATLMAVLNSMPMPVIAAVQGSAFGGGVGLVACCDIAIAVEKARFCLSEVRLGLIPAVISPYVVEAIGARAARRYFLTAEQFSARTACDLGLVHEVVASEEMLDKRIAQIVDDCLCGGPEAQADAKQLIRDVAGQPVTDGLQTMTASRIAAARVRPEGQEGLTAFLEKRKPDWVQPAPPAIPDLEA